MNLFDSIVGRVARGAPIPLPLALALGACTPVTRIGMWRRARMPRHRVNAYVVSIGNITAGGTGKTPAVIERAQIELARGRRVAVLTRGYAAPSGNTPFDSPELGDRAVYHALGDEAALVLQKVPGVIVIKNADRVEAAQRAVQKYGCDLLILDDGFQQLRLERNEDVVMIDATSPFGNGRLVPRGILREPITGLTRATHLVLTNADRATNLDAVREQLAALAPHAPIRTTRHAPVAVRNLSSGERHPIEWLRGQSVTAVCAIAYPERFTQSLESLGACVRDVMTARDHAPVELMLKIAQPPILITEKDAARLTSTPPRNTYALEIELRDLS